MLGPLFGEELLHLGTLVVEKQISVTRFDSRQPEVPEEKPSSADDKPKSKAPKLSLQLDFC